MDINDTTGGDCGGCDRWCEVETCANAITNLFTRSLMTWVVQIQSDLI